MRLSASRGRAAFFTATRKYRGVEYQIEVKNPNGVCQGAKSVTVDCKKIAGNVIPYEAGK